MPKFKVTFTRPVTSLDTCDRIIEAASEEEAREIANDMAGAFDSDCPDDATADGSEECGEWSADEMEPAPDSAVADNVEEEA